MRQQWQSGWGGVPACLQDPALPGTMGGSVGEAAQWGQEMTTAWVYPVAGGLGGLGSPGVGKGSPRKGRKVSTGGGLCDLRTPTHSHYCLT